MADTPSLEELIAGLDATDQEINDVTGLQSDISEIAGTEQVPEEVKEDLIDQIEDVETGDDLDALAQIIDAGTVDTPEEFVGQIQSDMAELMEMKQQVSGGPAPGFDPVTGDSNQMFISIDDDSEMPSYDSNMIVDDDNDDEIDYTGRPAEEIIADLKQNSLELLELLGHIQQ